MSDFDYRSLVIEGDLSPAEMYALTHKRDESTELIQVAYELIKDLVFDPSQPRRAQKGVKIGKFPNKGIAENFKKYIADAAAVYEIYGVDKKGNPAIAHYRAEPVQIPGTTQWRLHVSRLR